jgi:hypothetical protein
LKNIYKSIIIFIVLVVVASCEQTDQYRSIKFELKSGESITIYNSSETNVCFNVKTSFLYFGNQDIKDEILDLDKDVDSLSLAIKIWEFVIEKIDYLPNVFNETSLHDPLVQLNSLGYGQCDDLASMLYFLWKDFGFEARIWELGTHVVPEVKINNKWMMFDPSFQVFYYNSDGEIAGVEELAVNEKLITNPIKILQTLHSRSIDLLILDSLRYSSLVSELYTSGSNRINELFHQTYRIHNMEFCVPAKAKLKFPITQKDGLINEYDWHGKQLVQNVYAKLILKPKTRGKVRIPLIMVAAIGDADLYSNWMDKEYRVDSAAFTFMKFIDTAIIANTGAIPTEIYYKLSFNNKNSFIVEIESANLNHLVFKVLHSMNEE